MVSYAMALSLNKAANAQVEDTEEKEKAYQGTEATATTADTYSMQTTESEQISSLTKSITLLAEDNKSMKEAMARMEKRMEKNLEEKVNGVATQFEENMEKMMDMSHTKILASTDERITNLTTKMNSSFTIINNSLLTITKTLNLIAPKGAASVSELLLPILTDSQNSALTADTPMPLATTSGKRRARQKAAVARGH